MQNALVNVNGQILTAQDAKVSVYDRSYLYGDSLYEVARTYRGQFFLLDEHLARLEASAKLCRMVLGQTVETYKAEILKSFDAFRKTKGNEKLEAYCRIVVSRGTGKIGFGLANLLTPTQYAIFVQPVDQPSPEQFARGLKLQISDRLRNDRRALDPAMKSGNYLNSLLAYLEAANDGFDDALLCDHEGSLTEGTTFNIFYVRKGIVATPPLDVGILEGVTRRRVIDLARVQGIEVREVRFPRERLFAADEVFMSSSVREVFPVTRVDETEFGPGPGPITLRLAQAYRQELPGAAPK